MAAATTPTVNVHRDGSVDISWMDASGPLGLESASPSESFRSPAAASTRRPRVVAADGPRSSGRTSASSPRDGATGNGGHNDYREMYNALHKTFQKSSMKLQRCSKDLRHLRRQSAAHEREVGTQKRIVEQLNQEKKTLAAELETSKAYSKKLELKVVGGPKGHYLADKNTELRERLRSAKQQNSVQAEALANKVKELEDMEGQTRVLRTALSLRTDELGIAPGLGPGGGGSAADLRENLLFQLAKCRYASVVAVVKAVGGGRGGDGGGRGGEGGRGGGGRLHRVRGPQFLPPAFGCFRLIRTHAPLANTGRSGTGWHWNWLGRARNWSRRNWI